MQFEDKTYLLLIPRSRYVTAHCYNNPQIKERLIILQIHETGGGASAMRKVRT